MAVGCHSSLRKFSVAENRTCFGAVKIERSDQLLSRASTRQVRAQVRVVWTDRARHHFPRAWLVEPWNWSWRGERCPSPHSSTRSTRSAPQTPRTTNLGSFGRTTNCRKTRSGNGLILTWYTVESGSSIGFYGNQSPQIRIWSLDSTLEPDRARSGQPLCRITDRPRQR